MTESKWNLFYDFIFVGCFYPIGASLPLFYVSTLEKKQFKGTLDWEFFGSDFELCVISLLVMLKY